MNLPKMHKILAVKFLNKKHSMNNFFQLFTQMMRDVIVERTAAEWMEIFAAENIPAALVAEFQDLPDDPQVLAKDLAMVPAQDVGMARVIRDPINVDGLDRVGAKPAPEMGEHTDEVLQELGFTPAEIAAWREAGIV